MENIQKQNLNNSYNTDKYICRLIEETEEIIKNFSGISKSFGEATEIISEKNDIKNTSMYSLGRRIIHKREEFLDPKGNLGNGQIGL